MPNIIHFYDSKPFDVTGLIYICIPFSAFPSAALRGAVFRARKSAWPLHYVSGRCLAGTPSMLLRRCRVWLSDGSWCPVGQTKPERRRAEQACELADAAPALPEAPYYFRLLNKKIRIKSTTSPIAINEKTEKDFCLICTGPLFPI